ncbi:hypothetical protein [Halioxenophilus sp. WMMB6]|uniref:hypothetical protein n=1 Tax=Halioxenophilus sp. WMMB6 TaxID=3073815 RepID=UPI00295F37A1|nr:hypothetical protein [Halioxenophilus sp. WMMB6]
MRGGLWICLVLAGLLQACAVKVPIESYSERLVEKPVHRAHSKVVIFIPEQIASESFSQHGLLAVGALLDWQMAAGDAIADSSKNFFENYFANVEVREKSYVRGECTDCALAVKPIIDEVSINKLTMQATVKMTFSIYDSDGAEILHLPITGRSKFLTLERLGVGIATASLPVPGISSLAGNHVLAGSVEDAFDDAFWRLHLKMKDYTETGALARNWLPKELRRKSEYGRYEFAAERTIKAAGCQLPQDGLRLIESGIEELYEAYCWRQEPFMVSCNGSQCSLVYPEPQADNVGFALE